MSVYKLYAESDATIYSEYETMNTGLDSILEITKEESVLFPDESTVSRILIKFNQDEIVDIINNKIKNSNFDVYLKLYVADAGPLPTNFNVYTYPLYESWVMGTGKFGNLPWTKDGASWKYANASTASAWPIVVPSNVTSSFSTSSMGGGTWYTDWWASQSMSIYSTKDLTLKVTDIVHQFVSNSIDNNGFIIMNENSIEYDINYTYKLNYFSRDTNTIYPPVLEFRWDDSSYTVGPTVNSNNMYVTIKNNLVEFKDSSVHRFRVAAKEQFPVRVFSTSSLYVTNKILPSASYYSVRDAKTNDVIIDFDDNYTKISSDTNGSYFDLYMNGLQPERYYRILIKTIVDNNTMILDDQYFFKVEE